MYKGLVITEDSIYIGSDNDLIQKDLKRLIEMRLEDAIGQLDIGCRIADMLDTPISPALAKAMVDEASTVISLFEPRIEMESIAVSVDENGNIEGETEYTMVLILTFHKKETPGVQETILVPKVYVV